MVQGWFVASLHELFSKDGFRPRKSAGQNFLVDTKILGRIESVIRPPSEDVMLEVGGGTGALTERLVKKKSPLIVVESDHKLFDHLERTFGNLPHVHLVKADIMKLDLAPFVPPSPGKITLVGNIPYYLTTPLITRLLEKERGRIRSISLMIQKEVAERLGAQPGTKSWGALSVCAGYWSNFQMLFPVPRLSFKPAPKVESAFVRLTPIEKPMLDEEGTKNLFRLVRAIFQTRRKTLLNSLKSGGWTDEVARKAIEECRLKPEVRGETLNLEHLVELSLLLEKAGEMQNP
jgi:16S rRNA (adenine1518-N6/adenine1519-N6)-dimethyltransferase